MNEDITQEELISRYIYDPDTGIFRYRDNGLGRFHRAGAIAGGLSSTGHLVVKIKGTAYKAHRLAWLYMTGEWPSHFIDHINCIPDDNRWCNLREATNAQNLHNAKVRAGNKTGFKGVCAKQGKYTANIGYLGKIYYIGIYDTPEEAHEAYCKKADELHGEFANYG